ncbi:monovalent cation:proton antiporter-2 (CPA2) family protein [Nitrospirillum amazonense]|uniref:monovalent cation:proton antiporter-2 (CPA2) family protein n=1 Tax=Nitrospirillum amazonense TaxID=28077 RepID=UPI0024127B43|nr:monovalent cation:proton antiporter-2 (CPA2) family protein [Nitrospirillum amazonense]MDG3441823.1 monovalent cation:proton antiporter-2 (CPA2) family protein [Nitrospirillum amazonense]
MTDTSSGVDLMQIVAVLGAGVVAAPLFKRLGFGAILGYLAAGLAIGPFGFRILADPAAVLHFAELGVVMFLFLIGLEMRPAKLWTLRRQIFGLGVAQAAVCGALMTIAGVLAGFPPAVAFVAAMGFAQSSTAAIIQTLEEKGEMSTPFGQRAMSILLLEDLSVVPLLAVVALLAPEASHDLRGSWVGVAVAAAAVAVVIVAGRWVLNPLFGLLAGSRVREAMTAAALAVVLGAALLMESSGLSMAMGAFLAGVLLSGSGFRHQLEADIEPFRGLLLGLFFMAVGMSLDLSVVAAEWRMVLLVLAGCVVTKAAGIYAVARISGADGRESIQRTTLFAQGGEFAFVLYGAGMGVGVLDGQVNAVMTATVILSMVLTPMTVRLVWSLLPEPAPDTAGLARPDGLDGAVLIIGFGRFGQVVSQTLLARGLDVTIIDTDVEMIQAAASFGFQIYYGDGTNLDVLHASGAGRARAVAVCVDGKDTANKIVDLVKSSFPHAGLLVRAYDRRHTLHLIAAGVDLQVRETLESALAFGQGALEFLGLSEEEARETADEVRRRDQERVALEQASGKLTGFNQFRPKEPKPMPLFQAGKEARPLTPETREIAARGTPT